MIKEELEKIYGEVLKTSEAVQRYEFIAFCSPFVEVVCRLDGRKGTLEFQNSPRYYYKFIEYNSAKKSG